MDKNTIINYALQKIGSNNVNLLDGMTLVINNIFYNIYVNNGNITIDII